MQMVVVVAVVASKITNMFVPLPTMEDRQLELVPNVIKCLANMFQTMTGSEKPSRHKSLRILLTRSTRSTDGTDLAIWTSIILALEA